MANSLFLPNLNPKSKVDGKPLNSFLVMYCESTIFSVSWTSFLSKIVPWFDLFLFRFSKEMSHREIGIYEPRGKHHNVCTYEIQHEWHIFGQCCYHMVRYFQYCIDSWCHCLRRLFGTISHSPYWYHFLTFGTIISIFSCTFAFLLYYESRW